MTSLEGIPTLGRGLHWTNGEYMLGTSPGLGLGAVEMKDVGEAALCLQKVGRLEGRSEGEAGGNVRGAPCCKGGGSLCLVYSRCLGSYLLNK